MTRERDALNARLTRIQIDQGVITAATKRGLRPTAIPDITARARTVFRLVNGVPPAFEADGQTVRVGKDGITPMTLEEWVDSKWLTLLICLNRMLVAVLPATAPVEVEPQQVREESVPQGNLESHGANETAEIRPAAGGAAEEPRRERVTTGDVNYGKDAIGGHHHPDRV